MVFFCGTVPAWAYIYETPELEAQRADFKNARTALKKGHYNTFKRYARSLKDYPLYGYLEYEYLRKRISKTPNKTIEAFIESHEDSPISRRMRYSWLRKLANTGQWEKFLEEYRDSGGSAKLRCSHAMALYKTGKTEAAILETNRAWLVAKSQPTSCNQVFKIWEKNGGKTREMIWERIELAIIKGRVSLANYLAKELSKEDRLWVNRWIQMRRRPAANLHRNIYKVDLPIARKIVRHGVMRLARRDAGAAADYWQEVRNQHLQIEPEEVADVDQYVALRASYQKHPQALEWLGQLHNPSKKAQDWRIRAALAQQDWWAALTWIEALPAVERDTAQWRYWRARILEMQSRQLPVLRTAADRIFGSLAKERSYHGFLAADRTGRDYDLNSNPLIVSDDELNKMSQRPAVRRAYELYRLGMHVEARREWYTHIRGMDSTELQTISVLASKWGWHDRAIQTVAKSNHYDDLDLRFPIEYLDLVMANAQDQQIDPAWIYGVLRQESAFMPDARSSAGALGLMQLMPRTGRITAKKLKTRIRSSQDILNVNKNIKLGSAYLRRMLDRNEGHSALATASYNAGPHRVSKWIPEETISADLWVESIPFNETRQYVRRVMAYTVIYDQRLDGDFVKMRTRMPVVKAKK